MARKALILMATYNGEKYIQDQIQSIIDQSYRDWDLCISDDGSTDNTITIINNFRKLDSRILPVLTDNRDHGSCTNFYHLLRYAKKHKEEYSFFLLSDQDDIWESDKIKLQIEYCDSISSENIPILVYTDLSIMNGDGIVSCRMSNIQEIELKNPVNVFFNQIYVWGNTILINNKLIDELNIPCSLKNSLSHDHYLAFFSAVFGRVVFLNKALTRYRRYDSNVSAMPQKYSPSKVIKRIILEPKKIVSDHASNFNNILYFIREANRQNETSEALYECFLYGGIRAYKYVSNNHIRVGANKYNRIAKKIILYSRIYKLSKKFKSGKECS